MTRGVPLTTEQIEQAAEVYARTGNYSEAARAIGVDPDTVAKRLKARGERKRSELHARATDAGLRRGRKALVGSLGVLDRYIGKHIDESDGVPSIEPRDLAALLQARAQTVRTLAQVQERAEQHEEAPLRRRKLRAETEIAEMRRDGTLPAEKHELALTDARAALAAAIAGGAADGPGAPKPPQ